MDVPEEPALVAGDEAVVPERESVIAEPEPVTVGQDPVFVGQEAVVGAELVAVETEPEPVVVEPEFVVVESESVVAEPASVVVEPEPGVSEPEPVVEESEPTGQEPESADAAAAEEAIERLEATLSPRQQERVAAKLVKETLVGRAEQGAITWGRDQGLTQMRELMEEWKKAGHAGKSDDEQLWQQFSAARDFFFARLNLERENRKTQMDEAARRKEELCAQAEEAVGLDDVRKAADTMTALMAEWKKAGRAQRHQDEELWQRFKAAQDQVFARLADERRASGAARRNAASVKADVIARARILIGEIDLGEARAQMRKLGDEFRAAGFAGRAQNADLNAEFQKVRDEFYEWAKQEPQRRRESGHRNDYFIRTRKLSDAQEVRDEIERVAAELAAARPESSKRQHGTSIRLSLGGQDSYSELSADLIRLRLRLAQLERQVSAIDAKLVPPPECESPDTD